MKVKACGDYATNCYIISSAEGDIIIDPGVDSMDFIAKNCENVLAILNTHGHHDHIWANALVKEKYGAKLYIHEDDAFMLQDPFNTGFIKHEADFLLKDKQSIKIADLDFEFYHLPGHTPGCCMIKRGDFFLSGDFLFKGSIGRYDFPYSNPKQMLESLQKALGIKDDFILYPGHGIKTTLKAEQRLLPSWIAMIKDELGC